MSVRIVDASVAAKWFFEEAYTDEALLLLNERYSLHAPDFFLVEIDSVVCKRVRRREVDMESGTRIRSAIREYPIQRHPFETLLEPAFEIAIHTGLSLYDCLYVALAIMLEGKLVTADRRLRNGLARGHLGDHVLWVEDL
jgi:predicted nucleic acid-binding protein